MQRVVLHDGLVNFHGLSEAFMPGRLAIFEFLQARGAVSRYGEGVIASVSAEDAQQKYVPGSSTDTVISG